ncbi:catechol 2,3-dioxygenase-like lactoylglutathione lyase family enzyme [Paenibacillus anaericanus]|uniref:Glyoxalase n=1 Tax=Paenibacillus anaericanus TaxID=170367 RepID=A0A3S1DRK5_9BACL|nr:VOC family protein [Paenibacillus anaericanus]MDQ0088671.1 catechol 2,3-dioxygenase-like lactoylglutathione lyase family enzyme [Paenibacillus anaericanus]RUT47529.1 glyoxalase [Paenibacillus anaericanus]
MIPQRVTLVTLGALDLPSLRSFYKRLGWEDTPTSTDEYCVFTTAGVLLSLFPYHELVKDAGLDEQVVSDTKPSFRGITLAVNVEEPELVDDAIEKAREAGALILREPEEAFWGGRTAYFADPEYNVWEIAWNPSAVFDETGAMISF